ncbi:hypothetical protein AP1H75_00760 [Apilactobacillus apinorum]
MLIKVLLILATIILFVIGTYLIKHTDKPFMLLHPESNSALSKIVKFFGIVYLILALFAAVAVFVTTLIFVTIIMVISCIMILVMELLLVTFITKK